MVFIAAFLHQEEDCVYSALGGKWDTWHVVDVRHDFVHACRHTFAKQLHTESSKQCVNFAPSCRRLQDCLWRQIPGSFTMGMCLSL